MTILDQPIPVEEAPVKRRWTWFEKIAPAVLIILILWREIFSTLWIYEWIEYYGYALAGAYASAYYWIAKPEIITVRTVLVTILYGVFFSIGILLFLCWTLLLIGGGYKEVVLGFLAFFFPVLLLDVLLAWGKRMVANSRTLIRGAVLGCLLAVMYQVPESSHVIFTYRKYPDFVAFYKEREGSAMFHQIWNEYFKTHPYPSE